jgi:hypothetical protein
LLLLISFVHVIILICDGVHIGIGFNKLNEMFMPFVSKNREKEKMPFSELLELSLYCVLCMFVNYYIVSLDSSTDRTIIS